MFRSKRNRRRVDAAKQTRELSAVAKHHGPAFFKVVGLLAVSAGVFFGSIEGLRWARSTPYFGLKTVNVTGNDGATDVELARLAGLAFGQNLLAMEVPVMERAIAEHPWVRQVSISRRLPSGLTIEVDEHRAVALLSLGELYLVNEASEPFKRLKAGDDFDLPLVTGLDRETFARDREGSFERLRGAVALIEAYGAEEALRGVPLSEVHLHADGVRAVTSGGVEIEFGEGDLSAALARLVQVRRALHERELVAEVIRLDNRTRPSWVAVQVSAKKP